MDQRTEQEQPKPEIINLDQEFTPFESAKTDVSIIRNKPQPNSFTRTILLDTEGVSIPIRIVADIADEDSSKYEAILPFSPESGYRITQEDFDSESRSKKIQSMKNQKIDFATAPLNLLAGADREDLHALGLSDASIPPKDLKLKEYFYDFKPGVESIMKKLHLQVFFPNGLSFESKPSQVMLDEADLHYGEFYALDLGTLAKVRGKASEGVNLHLPSDPVQLSQIKARFVFKEPHKPQKTAQQENA